MKYTELDTPALLVDRDIMMDNLRFMQDYADRQGVALRPHTKTHKTPAIAKLQEELGAKGITVAKVGVGRLMTVVRTVAAHRSRVPMAWPWLASMRT